MVTLEKNPWRVLFRAKRGLSESDRHRVDESQYKAIAYAWGWQDAGGAPMDSEAAYNFGIAYAIHAAQYARGASHLVNIRGAFQLWSQGLPLHQR